MNIYHAFKLNNQMTCDSFYYLSEDKTIIDDIKNKYNELFTQDDFEAYPLHEDIVSRYSDLIYFDDVNDDVITAPLHNTNYSSIVDVHSNKSYIVADVTILSERF